MNEILFSIISVCFNCENKVERTIRSLEMQTCKNYEYIVIDGNSTDGTLQTVKELLIDIPNTTIISESDQGIYDAMNKGICIARGKYIFFLNMGDEFYDKDILASVEIASKSEADFYFGNICKDGLIINQKGKATIGYALVREYMICHQSIFVLTNILKELPFNIKYRICADRDWFIKILRAGKTGEYIDLPICKFESDGLSSNYSKFEKESIAITKEYGGLLLVVLIKIKRFLGKIFALIKWRK